MKNKYKRKGNENIETWVSEETLDKLGFTKIPRDIPGELPERAFESFIEPGEFRGEIMRVRRTIYFGEYFKKTKSCTAVLSTKPLDLAGIEMTDFGPYWGVTNVYIPKKEYNLFDSRLMVFEVYREMLKLGRSKIQVKPEDLEKTLTDLYGKPVERNLRRRLKKLDKL